MRLEPPFGHIFQSRAGASIPARLLHAFVPPFSKQSLTSISEHKSLTIEAGGIANKEFEYNLLPGSG